MTPAIYCPKGKRAYATQEDAQKGLKAITRLQSTGVRGLRAQRAYLCPWCDHWHLTHKQERA